MNYVWLETSLMSLIFIVAAIFAIQHFLPGFFTDIRRLVMRKKMRNPDIRLVAANDPGSCRSKCSACNGCSLARK